MYEYFSCDPTHHFCISSIMLGLNYQFTFIKVIWLKFSYLLISVVSVPKAGGQTRQQVELEYVTIDNLLL
jgi:hypothetical protein